MPFGLKNALSKFQRIMNEIYNPFIEFIIVYIDDAFVFSKNLEQHFKHLNVFLEITQRNGLAILKNKIILF